jgi:hypothetical protein
MVLKDMSAEPTTSDILQLRIAITTSPQTWRDVTGCEQGVDAGV